MSRFNTSDFRHSGGVTDMPSQISAEISNLPYQSIYPYKIIALLDGDKENQGNSRKSNSRTEYARCEIEKLGIVWHQLHKRAIENYVPIDQILQNPNIDPIIKTALVEQEPEALDFYKYPKATKARILKIFLEPFSYDKIEARCSHHRQFYSPPWSNAPPIEISEIEVILLKIAQIL
jgi:hypothetical protein